MEEEEQRGCVWVVSRKGRGGRERMVVLEVEEEREGVLVVD